MIQLTKPKLPKLVLDHACNANFTTYEEYQNVMIKWDNLLSKPFNWSAYSMHLQTLGLGYLVPLLRQMDKYQDQHEFASKDFYQLVGSFPRRFISLDRHDSATPRYQHNNNESE